MTSRIDWKPIITMPENRRDGRQMLGYANDDLPEWHEAFTMSWRDGDWMLAPGGPVECNVHPTHWADINPPEDTHDDR